MVASSKMTLNVWVCVCVLCNTVELKIVMLLLWYVSCTCIHTRSRYAMMQICVIFEYISNACFGIVYFFSIFRMHSTERGINIVRVCVTFFREGLSCERADSGIDRKHIARYILRWCHLFSFLFSSFSNVLKVLAAPVAVIRLKMTRIFNILCATTWHDSHFNVCTVLLKLRNFLIAIA